MHTETCVGPSGLFNALILVRGLSAPAKDVSALRAYCSHVDNVDSAARSHLTEDIFSVVLAARRRILIDLSALFSALGILDRRRGHYGQFCLH